MDDDAMAKYPGLYTRNGVWQVRKLIPADLTTIFPKPLRESLGTRDKREAIKRYHLKVAEAELAFERARAELRSRPRVEAALACGNLEELGRPALEALVLQWWQRRRENRRHGLETGLDYRSALANVEEEANDISRAIDEGLDVVGDMTDRMLVDLGSASRPHRVGQIKTHVKFPAVNKDAIAYQQLRLLVAQGLRFEEMLARDRATGDSTSPHHPLFNPRGDRTTAKLTTIGDLITAFSEDRKRLNRAPTSKKKYALLFRAIEEHWTPELPLADITRAHCVDLVNFIERLPANGVKFFPKLTLSKMIEEASKGGHKLLSEGSVKSY